MPRLRAPRRFGDASLTILPHPALAVGDNGGHDCQMVVLNTQNTELGNVNLQSSSQWNTDDWMRAPVSLIGMGTQAFMGSEGGFLRGCGFQAVYTGGH